MARWLDSEYNRLAGAVEKGRDPVSRPPPRREVKAAPPSAEEIAAIRFVQSERAKTDWTRRILAEMPPEDEDVELVAGAD